MASLRRARLLRASAWTTLILGFAALAPYFFPYRFSFALETRGITPWGQSAYAVQLPWPLSTSVPAALLGGQPDSNDRPQASNLELREQGAPLGPAHAQHARIAQEGSGRYSHWGGTVIFSSSDNKNLSAALGRIPTAESPTI